MSERYLNTIETVMANNHAVYKGTSQVVTLLYIDYKISSQQVKVIWDEYNSRNPLLLQRLFIQNRKWRLQKNTGFILNYETYKFEDEFRDFDTILENEVNDILDYNHILTKLKLIYFVKNQGCLVILTQHHAIADTYTAKKILRDVINSVSTEEEEKNYHNFPAWKPCHAKEVANYEVKQYCDLNNEFMLAIKKLSNSFPVKWTTIDTWIVDAERVNLLAEYAKQLNCHLNSLLTVIMSIGVIGLLDIHNINTYSAVSYRKNKKYDDVFGCLLEVVNISIKDWDIEDSTRRFERQINYIKNSLKDELETTSQIVAEYKKKNLCVQKSISLCEGIGFTNSGRTDSLKFDNGIKIIDYRSVANRTSGALFFTFHMSFHKGQLITSAVSSGLLLDKKDVQLFIDNINKYIDLVIQRVT